MKIYTNIAEIELNAISQSKLNQLTSLRELIPDKELGYGNLLIYNNWLQKNFKSEFILLDYNKFLVLENRSDYILEELSSKSGDVFDLNLTKGERKNINIEDENFFKRILARIFSIGMMKKEYSVTSNNEIYYVAHRNKVENFGDMQIWKGFEFIIRLINNKYHVIIDPKRKMHNVSTLADDQKDEKYYNNLKANQICPVENCRMWASAYPLCRYSSPNLVTIDSKRDEKVIDGQYNVKDYFKDEKKCPTSYLPEHIDENNYTVNVKLYPSSNQKLKYPLELLREVPSMDKIPFNLRSKAMNKIQPSPEERFFETINSRKLLTPAIFQNFQEGIKVDRLIESSEPTRIDKLKDNLLLFHSDKGFSPRKLKYVDPYDLNSRNFSELKIGIKTDINSNEIFEEFYDGFKDGVGSYPGFIDLFSIKENELSIEKYNQDENYDLILMLKQERSDKTEPPFTKIAESITLYQYAHLDSYNDLKSRRGRVSNYFYNISLKVYSALGGKPWRLEETLPRKSVGVSISKISRNQYRLLFVFFDENGNFSHYKTVTSDRYSESETLNSFYQEAITEDLDIYLLGNRYRNFINYLENFCEGLDHDVQILTVINSRVRLYVKNPQTNEIIGAPRGTLFKLDKKSAVLRTTQIKQPVGDESQYDDSYATPQTIEIDYITDGFKFDECLRNIFSLTRVYTGYSLALSKLPAPLHVLQKLSNIKEIPDNPYFTNKLWFI